MGAIGPWQIILVLVLAVLLFGGRGRISSIMGDVAKGIKSFRKGMAEEDKTEAVENKKADEDIVTLTPEEMAKEKARSAE